MWAGAALVALVLVAYLPALFGDLHCFDDDEYIVINPLMRSLGGLVTMWIIPTATPQYYPMTFTTFWAEYQLWGDHAFGYHLNNVLLHAVCAILLWRLLVRLEVNNETESNGEKSWKRRAGDRVLVEFPSLAGVAAK